MSGSTRKLAYQRHRYSGVRKSSKRSKSALKRLHGDDNRVKIWRSEEIKKKLAKEQIIPDDSIVAQNTQPRTYARVKPKVHLEATYNVPTSTVTAESEVVEPDLDLDINWPQADPEIESFQFTAETVPNTCLSGISGYRIVDLRHVIEWVFLMERHRNLCESSQIEFVSERRDGFRSALTFKCSMCGKTWEHCTESNDKQLCSSGLRTRKSRTSGRVKTTHQIVLVVLI